MDIVELNKQLSNKQQSNFYVFVGEEITLANIYLNRMSNLTRVDTVAEVWSKLTTKSKLIKNTTNTTYVIRDDTEFTGNSKLEQLIGQIKYNTLVLCITELKKTSKAYKVLKDYIVEFNTMTTKQLVPHVKKICPMDNTKCEQFIEACDNNYGVILSELDKVKYTSNDIIQEAIDNSVSYNSFTLTDMLFSRNVNTVEYATRLLDTGVNEMGILTLILNKASQLLQLEEGVTPAGMNDWVAKGMVKANRLNTRQLYRATRWSKLYEEGIKSGDYEAYDAVLLCIMKILN